jgi:hypothetical protein
LDTAGAGKLLDWKYYPLTDYTHVNNTSQSQDLLVNFGVSYKILPVLTIELKYQHERQGNDGKVYYDKQSYLARDLVNRFSQLNRSTGIVKYMIPMGGILDLANDNLEFNGVRGQLNFNKRYNKHALGAIAGGESRETKLTSNSSRAYGYNDDILTFSNVDYVNPYPSFVSGSSSQIPNNQNFGNKLNRFVSVYANAAYTYNSKYSLSISGRRDGSNLFGATTNNKWTPLWSAGVGWNISGENFYQVSFLPYLKLRVTYGVAGNVDPSMSAVTTVQYLSSNNPNTGTNQARVNNFYNPDLRWEKVRTINAGIDFKSISDRITGSIDAYQKEASDLFGDVLLDYTTGLARPLIRKNIGKLRTQGLDVVVNSVNIDKKFKWNTSFLFSFNKEKIISYYFASGTSSAIGAGGKAIAEGNAVHGIYSFQWAGLDPQTGDPQGYFNGNLTKDYSVLTNNTAVADLVYSGSDVPTIFGSISNTFSWKGFSLSALVSYRLGYYFRRQTINYSNLFRNGTGYADFSQRWQKAGDEQFTTVPSMTYPAVGNRDLFYNNAEILAENAGNIRLQFVNLGYDLTKEQIKKLPFDWIHVYVNANNLGILWRANNEEIDPDNQNTYTVPRAISIGLRTSF